MRQMVLITSKMRVFFFTFCQTNPVTNVDLSVLLSERKRKEEERLGVLHLGLGNFSINISML